jgi:aspartate oxidase
VALLTLKMNALWQEFYSMDDMTPRDHIQRQISETYLKLQKAQIDAEQAKKEMEEAHRKSRKN